MASLEVNLLGFGMCYDKVASKMKHPMALGSGSADGSYSLKSIAQLTTHVPLVCWKAMEISLAIAATLPLESALVCAHQLIGGTVPHGEESYPNPGIAGPSSLPLRA